MSKIRISLNEVFRKHIIQLIYTYEKYIGTLDINEEDVTNYNLIDFFKFDSITKLNSFLYSHTIIFIIILISTWKHFNYFNSISHNI